MDNKANRVEPEGFTTGRAGTRSAEWREGIHPSRGQQRGPIPASVLSGCASQITFVRGNGGMGSVWQLMDRRSPSGINHNRKLARTQAQLLASHRSEPKRTRQSLRQPGDQLLRAQTPPLRIDHGLQHHLHGPCPGHPIQRSGCLDPQVPQVGTAIPLPGPPLLVLIVPRQRFGPDRKSTRLNSSHSSVSRMPSSA